MITKVEIATWAWSCDCFSFLRSLGTLSKSDFEASSCISVRVYLFFVEKIKHVRVFPPFSHSIQCGVENIRRAESLNGNPLFSKVSIALQPF